MRIGFLLVVERQVQRRLGEIGAEERGNGHHRNDDAGYEHRRGRTVGIRLTRSVEVGGYYRRGTADEPDDDDNDDDYDDEDEDGTVNPKIDKIINIMGIAAAVVIIGIFVFLIGSFFGLFRFGSSGSKSSSSSDESSAEVSGSASDLTETVTMINILGMTESEAKNALDDIGLTYENEGTESSDTYEEGTICVQSREEGALINKDTIVRYKVSSGKGTISIPDVTGQTETAATSMLSDKGFEVSKQFEYSDSVAQGVVISQSPAEGTEGKEQDTVTIVIST